MDDDGLIPEALVAAIACGWAGCWRAPTGRIRTAASCLDDAARGLRCRRHAAPGVTARAAYLPGNAFYADGLGTRQLRLSYCFPPERIAEGIRRLAGVLSGELEVMRTFGTGASRPISGPSSPAPDTA